MLPIFFLFSKLLLAKVETIGIFLMNLEVIVVSANCSYFVVSL